MKQTKTELKRLLELSYNPTQAEFIMDFLFGGA